MPEQCFENLFAVGAVRRTQAHGHPVQAYSFDHGGSGIKIIEVYCGYWIDSLRVQYKMGNGDLIWSNKVGGSGGGNFHQIILEDGEEIVAVTGEYGYHYGTGIITSLNFETSRNRKLGPFGNVGSWFWAMTNTVHSFQIRGRVVGFHGTAGEFVSSIGCYTRD